MRIPKFVRDHAFFFAFYGAVFVLFLWPLLLFQKTFLFGDYWQQHFPWAHEYARHVLRGTLPYWVRGMACGFPLVAEGQVGAYYLLNLALYRFVPFMQAYNLSILLHVALGGAGFYLYLRRIGLSVEASTVGATLFSFGFGYGGCFTNTATLRAMAWLPWCLWGFDRFDEQVEKSVYSFIAMLGIFFAQMWTAGSPQIALYATGYVLLYWVLLFRGRQWLAVAGMLGVAVVLSAPQWMASAELLRESVRAGESASFALWGSVFPPALTSLVFPKWGDGLGISFYLGEALACLCLAGLLSKKTSREKIHYFLAALFLLAALGKYNPLYAAAVKTLSITFFRNPGKFLFFAGVSLSVAAAYGYDHLARIAQDRGRAKRYTAWLAGVTAAVLAAPFAAGSIFGLFSDKIRAVAKDYATQAFADKKSPVQTLEQYQGRAEDLFQRLRPLFDYTDFWNLAAFFFFLLTALVVVRSLKPGRDAWRRYALPAVLAADLVIFGYFIGSGFIGNARDVSTGFSAPLVSQLRREEEESGGLFVEWAKDPARELFPPSSNLHYELSSPSGYSPLLLKRYYELTRELGIVDSSLGRAPFSLDVWRRQHGLWRALGVSQIVADEPLDLADASLYSKIRQAVPSPQGLLRTERYWYVVQNPVPPVYAVYDWKVIPGAEERLAYLKSEAFDPGAAAVVEETGLPSPAGEVGAAAAHLVEDGDMKVEAEIEVKAPALAVFTNARYPGWKARVDGREQPIVTVNHAFSGVFLDAGEHRVEFFYDRGRQAIAEKVSMLGWFALFYSNFLLWKRRRNVKGPIKAR